MCQIIEDLQDYFEFRSSTEERCRIYLKRIEHVYYKVSLYAYVEELGLKMYTLYSIMCIHTGFIHVMENLDKYFCHGMSWKSHGIFFWKNCMNPVNYMILIIVRFRWLFFHTVVAS